MPNWACGTVEVKGKWDGVISFTGRFPGRSGRTGGPGVRFFARSFSDDDRESVVRDILKQTEKDPENAAAAAELSVSFAWSAYCCVVDGYPRKYPDECITLSEACRLDRVRVRIRTEEPGLFFEEEITADEHGNLTYSSKDLKTARCLKCGNTQGTASFADPDCLVCCECGGDMELVEEE